MAKRKTTNKQNTPPEAAPTFEASLEVLQQIVAELEDGTLGLEESMQRFEKGIGLLRHCYDVLGQAEQRIEVLTGTDAQGNPVTAPFDAPATVSSNKQSTGRKPNKNSANTGDLTETDDATDDDAEGTLF